MPESVESRVAELRGMLTALQERVRIDAQYIARDLSDVKAQIAALVQRFEEQTRREDERQRKERDAEEKAERDKQAAQKAELNRRVMTALQLIATVVIVLGLLISYIQLQRNR